MEISTDRATVHRGDCLDWLRSLPDCSVDALVTDPPAGIGFMGREWDKDKGGRDGWVAWLAGVMREAHRVLKPGAHGLVWSLPRTSHWTGTALEDAGFEVRDVIAHLFGTGFPKSLDVSKAIDKAAGVKPVGRRDPTGGITGGSETGARQKGWNDIKNWLVMPPATTPEAQQWDGWGTALKPAREDWWLVRKPLDGTVAQNVLEHGVGGLNVDGCRVPGKVPQVTQGLSSDPSSWEPRTERRLSNPHDAGRWPPHLLFSEHPGELHGPDCWLGDKAKYFPRFRYQAKPSRKERGAGNRHPTVKPIALMRWLCRLITPPGGLVIDPFTGSGTTGVAAVLEGFRFAGCEREPEYADIATARLLEALE